MGQHGAALIRNPHLSRRECLVDDDIAKRASRNPRARRIAAWLLLAAVILLPPWVGMRFTGEVQWNAADFLFAGGLVAAVATTYELAATRTRNRAYRAAVGVALAAAFVLVWVNAAVGIIGSENHPANRMFHGVLVVAIVGALIARFRPGGMAAALAATAAAQAAVGIYAVAAGLGSGPKWPLDILLLSAAFAGLWATSAWLFARSARL